MPTYEYGKSNPSKRPGKAGKTPSRVKKPESALAKSSNDTESSSSRSISAAEQTAKATYTDDMDILDWRANARCETEDGRELYSDELMTERARLLCDECAFLPRCAGQVAILNTSPNKLHPQLVEHLSNFVVLAGQLQRS